MNKPETKEERKCWKIVEPIAPGEITKTEARHLTLAARGTKCNGERG